MTGIGVKANFAISFYDPSTQYYSSHQNSSLAGILFQSLILNFFHGPKLSPYYIKCLCHVRAK